MLLVFALTGTTVVLIRRFLKGNFDWAHEKWFTYSYYWLILPFYNLMLLIYGFMLVNFGFFGNLKSDFSIELLVYLKQKRIHDPRS